MGFCIHEDYGLRAAGGFRYTFTVHEGGNAVGGGVSSASRCVFIDEDGVIGGSADLSAVCCDGVQLGNLYRDLDVSVKDLPFERRMLHLPECSDGIRVELVFVGLHSVELFAVSLSQRIQSKEVLFFSISCRYGGRAAWSVRVCIRC